MKRNSFLSDFLVEMKSSMILAVLVVYVVADGFDNWKVRRYIESRIAAFIKYVSYANPNTYKTGTNEASDKSAKRLANRQGQKYDLNIKESVAWSKVNFIASMQSVRNQGNVLSFKLNMMNNCRSIRNRGSMQFFQFWYRLWFLTFWSHFDLVDFSNIYFLTSKK